MEQIAVTTEPTSTRQYSTKMDSTTPHWTTRPLITMVATTTAPVDQITTNVSSTTKELTSTSKTKEPRNYTTIDVF